MVMTVQNHLAGYQQINAVSDVQKHPIGFQVQVTATDAAAASATYFYFKAASALAANAPVTDTASNRTGKAVVATPINNYGWAKFDPAA